MLMEDNHIVPLTKIYSFGLLMRQQMCSLHVDQWLFPNLPLCPKEREREREREKEREDKRKFYVYFFFKKNKKF